MEGAFTAAPRLARDFYKRYGWAPDPHPGGQAFSVAEINLRVKFADPNYEGQESLTSAASARFCGQAPNRAEIDLPAVQTASDPAPNGQANSPQEGIFNSSAVNFNLQNLLAPCGKLKGDASDPHHGQAIPHTMVASDPRGQAASFSTLAAPASIPKFTAAHVKASSSALSSPPANPVSSSSLFSSAIPSASPSRQHRLHEATMSSLVHASTSAIPMNATSPAIPVTSTSSSNGSLAIPAIPVLVPSGAANPHYRWADEVCTDPEASTPTITSSPILSAIPTCSSHHVAIPHVRWPKDEACINNASSSSTITSSSLGSTRLRAQASSWMPVFSSLLIGDLPLTPLLPSSTTSLPLPQGQSPPLLGSSRQPLAPTHPEETLGDGHPLRCSYCGHTPHVLSGCDTRSTSTLSFSPLRRESMPNQAREASVKANRQVIRPRRKAKGNFKHFKA